MENRLYLLPQYGSHKETKLDGSFTIYSIDCDSIGFILDEKDSSLRAYRSLKVTNLNNLPAIVKKSYEGFEAIAIANGKVFLSIETSDTYDSCYLLKGKLDTNKNEIFIDPAIYATVKRYPFIENAGFESIAYLPAQKKIIALYEYNGMPGGGTGFLLDTTLKYPAKIASPFLYFRLTDISVAANGNIYGLNYFWSGDYTNYLDNNFQRHEEPNIRKTIPDLQNRLNNDTALLNKNHGCYSRIVMLKSYKHSKWRQVTSFECSGNNWEGIALYRKGALIISDANRSNKQVTTLAYVKF